jgi:hypothetical protein
VRKRGSGAETPVGWRDERPDLTSEEHDMLVAMIEQAWRDVQIEMEGIPKSRRVEALAVKVSAWEWFTKEPEDYIEDGENPPRISFRAACLHLGIREESVRWTCFNRCWELTDNPENPKGNQIHKMLLHPVCPPQDPMPNKWREVFLGPDEPEKHREDRGYKKKKEDPVPSPKQPEPTNAPVVVAPLPAPVPLVAAPVAPKPPIPAVVASVPKPKKQKRRWRLHQEYCAVLDSAPVHHKLEDLASLFSMSRPAVAKDAMAAWEQAVSGDEEAE